jgi:diguanylate cyclase (GGDEF)-like protein
MLILTLGLIGWHKEQRFINQQLASRELHLRHYQLLDPLTKLYKPEYLLAVLKRELELQQQHQQPFCLALVDVSQFARFNREQGMAAADLLLQQLSELTLVQFRSGDLVCRYSGDKFVILMPQSNQATAHSLLQNATSQLSLHLHTQLHWTITEITAAQQVTKPQRLLSQLWQQLQKQKQQQTQWSLV